MDVLNNGSHSYTSSSSRRQSFPLKYERTAANMANHCLLWMHPCRFVLQMHRWHARTLWCTFCQFFPVGVSGNSVSAASGIVESNSSSWFAPLGELAVCGKAKTSSICSADGDSGSNGLMKSWFNEMAKPSFGKTTGSSDLEMRKTSSGLAFRCKPSASAPSSSGNPPSKGPTFHRPFAAPFWSSSTLMGNLHSLGSACKDLSVSKARFSTSCISGGCWR